MIKLNCDQATSICDKSQYNEASFLEKIKLIIHMLHCKYCNIYSKQNTILSKYFKKHGHQHGSHSKCLNHEEKCCMENNIKEKIG